MSFPILSPLLSLAASIRAMAGNATATRIVDPYIPTNGEKMASETLHEDAATLGPEIIDQHRAIASLMEELEAVDWYNQRAKATTDDELRGILEHNRDEEKEHAAMVLEWLRRHDAKLDKNLKTYLLTDK